MTHNISAIGGVKREEDSPLEEFLEDLMEILDPNGPITTPVATIGVLGK